MLIQRHARWQGDAQAAKAEEFLKQCVHCGFCTATCPTYQVLGNELDSPRGRIYLIKQMLEADEVTQETHKHLDLCLTCRNCETTCPSGVQYGELIELGRQLVLRDNPRPWMQNSLRTGLAWFLNSPWFGVMLKLGQWARPLVPASLREKIPAKRSIPAWPEPLPAELVRRKYLLLEGCVQPAMAPQINIATARLMREAGWQVIRIQQARCCGSVNYHLDQHDAALDQARANIDAWWPQVLQGVDGIVVNASGCAVMVKKYDQLLAHDPHYAEKAKRIVSLAKDANDLLADWVEVLGPRLKAPQGPVVFHPPCTWQHGQRMGPHVMEPLKKWGWDIRLSPVESHMCCGSAGTHSLLHPDMAHTLRDRKLGHLHSVEPTCIISSNMGCIAHLQSGTQVPVRHWVEVLDAALV